MHPVALQQRWDNKSLKSSPTCAKPGCVHAHKWFSPAKNFKNIKTKRPKASTTRRIRKRKTSTLTKLTRRPAIRGINLSTYAKMVSDPCNCPLVPGIYGSSEGLLSKTKKSFYDGSSSTCGFVLWCPDFHNGLDATHQTGNLFTWVHTNSAQPVANTTANPFGTGARFDATASTAHTEYDPAFNFVSEGLVQDARNISACIDLTYFGAMYVAEGEMTYVNGLPVTALLDQTSPLTVDRLFQWSNNTHRLGVDTFENVWRPSDDDIFYNSTADCVKIGVPGVGPSTLPENAEAKGPTVFGFAFRGLSSTQENKLRYGLTKIVEWRAKPSSGLAQTTSVATGVSVMQKVVLALDRAAPKWQHRILDAAGGVATRALEHAFTGSAPFSLARTGMRALALV